MDPAMALGEGSQILRSPGAIVEKRGSATRVMTYRLVMAGKLS